jgi:translation initiation factor IF-2
VVVMGHVDHGKTTLLDYIRKANVAAKEAGGITQSVGAYEITHPSTSSGQAQKITFIDTPGHEAFTAMRSRGAKVADLAILVVAADEGLKPQTQESIKILQQSETPFVVAITKIDKPGADVEKVKGELTGAGVLLEGFGGHVSYEPVSAKTGEHVDKLLDFILLAAEVEALTYDPAAPAAGFVLEARKSRERGCETTVILKNGTLKFGDEIATQTASGKVKILENFLGKAAKALEPSAPAVVTGFEKLPQAGEEFFTGEVAKALKEQASQAEKPASLAANPEETSANTLRLIIKAPDAGSLEALAVTVQNLDVGKPIKIVAQSVGDVIDNDVKLAISAGAVIAAFATRIDKGAKNLAEGNKVAILSADVIYHLIKAIEDFAASAHGAKRVGALEVLAVFNAQRLDKQVIGGKVVDGAFKNRVAFEVERGATDSSQKTLGQAGTVVGRGRVTNLQQGKQDTASVPAGNECGLMVNSDVAIQIGDMLVIK